MDLIVVVTITYPTLLENMICFQNGIFPLLPKSKHNGKLKNLYERNFEAETRQKEKFTPHQNRWVFSDVIILICLDYL